MKLRKDKKREEEAWPYEVVRNGRLLTDAEWFVYERLTQALDKHHVFCQVAMSHVVSVSKDHQMVKQGEVNWRGKIDREVLDYVICASDGKVVAVVELDDASSAKPERQRADAAKDKVLAAAGLHLVRWTMRTLPNRDEELRVAILEPKSLEGELEGGDVIESLPRLA